MTISRRDLLKSMGSGFGSLAFASLAARANVPASPLAAREPHFAPRAKRVIFLFMAGGPSAMDTFDYKPELNRNDGRESVYTGNPAAIGGAPRGRLFGSPFRFARHGQCGHWVSELYPHLARKVDDICFLHSVYCDSQVHQFACPQMHTGVFQSVRPSLGSWVTYGLGSLNENLPAFVAINPNGQSLTRDYGHAFLPAAYQGQILQLGQGGNNAPIRHLRNAAWSAPLQREQIDLIRSQAAANRTAAVDSQFDAMIASYELAFRMQMSVPELMDFSRESRATLELYGSTATNGRPSSFADQCLLARRLSEAGVRFVLLNHGGWDHHGGLPRAIRGTAGATDRPIAALLTDLKSRGLLEETLVIWGGEFGRTPVYEGTDGRGHNASGFTYWMAGGGVKSGMSYGATDEVGWSAVENKVYVHDLHATILHLLGLDHERLTYHHAGRDYRLTDVHGTVVRDILA